MPLFLFPFGAAVVVGSLRARRRSDDPNTKEPGPDQGFEGFARSIPARVWAFGASLIIFAVGTFLAGIAVLTPGSPMSDNGGYYLDYKGHRIRELSGTEFRRLVGYETRMYSGHLMIFCTVAWVYFTYREPRTWQPERDAG